jgi:hypothetical protein
MLIGLRSLPYGRALGSILHAKVLKEPVFPTRPFLGQQVANFRFRYDGVFGVEQFYG